MKLNAIVRIVIWSLVLAISLGAFLFLLDWDRGEEPVEFAIVDEVTAPLEGLSEFGYVEKLKIDWPSGTITIQPGDVHTIAVEESPVSDPKYAMVCTQDGDTLSIKYQENTAMLSIGKSLKKDLTITVPWEWYGTMLKVEMASAHLILRDVSVEQVEVDTASGASSFENCTIGELELDTASGGLDFSGRLGKLDVTAASANITARLLNVPDSLEVDSASGSLDLTLPKDAGFTAKFDTASGSFTSDFETTQEGNRYLCGDGSCKIEVETASGNVVIHKQS